VNALGIPWHDIAAVAQRIAVDEGAAGAMRGAAEVGLELRVVFRAAGLERDLRRADPDAAAAGIRDGADQRAGALQSPAIRW
jgi:hypothetical protein